MTPHIVCPACKAPASEANPACTLPDHRNPPPVRKLEPGWTVEILDGVEVLSTPPGLTYEQALDEANWPEGFKAEPITDEDGITEGSIVLIPGLFGGYGVYQVAAGEKGFMARSKSTAGMLVYGTDSRGCWTCSGIINTKAIKRLELQR